MKSKITDIRSKGSAQLKHGTFNKSEVFLANGNSYTFLSKGEFKKKVGDVIEYEVTNEEYGTAKLVYTQEKTYTRDNDTHNSILRQVAFKGAIELATSGKIKIDEVEEFTNQFNQILK
jgi:hypothetical protein